MVVQFRDNFLRDQEQIWTNPAKLHFAQADWRNSRNCLQFNYHHQKVSHGFLSGGGTVTDAGVGRDYCSRPSFGVSISLQYERWLNPVLQRGQQPDLSATVEFLFQPQKLFRQSSAIADFEAGGRP